MTGFHRTLAFRAAMPVFLFGLGLVVVSLWLARFAVSQFVEQRATNDLRWRSFAVHSIIDSSLDALQREAARLVEHVAMHREDVHMTFRRLRLLAATIHTDVAGSPGDTAASSRGRARAPRLTEPWFC